MIRSHYFGYCTINTDQAFESGPWALPIPGFLLIEEPYLWKKSQTLNGKSYPTAVANWWVSIRAINLAQKR